LTSLQHSHCARPLRSQATHKLSGATLSMHTCRSRCCELNTHTLSMHRSRDLRYSFVSTFRYRLICESLIFCHIFNCGNGGRLICGMAYRVRVIWLFAGSTTAKALRYGPCVTRGSHSFTCHPHTNHTCLYSPVARHHRPLAYSLVYGMQFSLLCCRLVPLFVFSTFGWLTHGSRAVWMWLWGLAVLSWVSRADSCVMWIC